MQTWPGLRGLGAGHVRGKGTSLAIRKDRRSETDTIEGQEDINDLTSCLSALC